MRRFEHPRANLVETDDGRIRVEVLGRVGIRYTEDDRSCLIDSEVLASEPPAIAVWPNGIRSWEPPHDRETLSDNDRERILANVKEAFASQDWRLDVTG